MSKPDFNPADVYAVARAIGGGVQIEDYGRSSHQVCTYCGMSRYHSWQNGSFEGFQHKPGCVVLIARDLLTGAPKEAA
ncbi:hypothetical protein UAM5_00066 [Ralstonia phage UAM5]|nr:hypothetical protein UAM5_00066 [Ralstonia phage UAM5]